MFHVMFSLPCLYVLVRFIWPLPWRPSRRIAAAVFLALASQYHLYCRFSSGSVFSPEMPRGVIIIFNWVFGAIVLLALLQLMLDLATLAAVLVRRRRLSIPVGARYALAVSALVLAAVGVSQAIRVPPLRDVEIGVKNLPPEFAGYRIVQLTDLHISRLFDAPWTQAVVERANRLDADLIVVTGDLIDGTTGARRADVESLRELRAPDGVYVIPGNHEYFFGFEAWVRYFSSLGMMPLVNSHAVIARQGAQLVLAGVTDFSAPATGFAPPDVGGAIQGAPKNAPIILLDHQPRKARLAAAQGVSLQLSGHTHGGLIVGLDRLFALVNEGFVSGFYDVDGMALYVNNGTALWPGLAMRLGKPSELTRITLRRAPD